MMALPTFRRAEFSPPIADAFDFHELFAFFANECFFALFFRAFLRHHSGVIPHLAGFRTKRMPPVERVRDLDDFSAALALKRPRHECHFRFFRMFPIQFFAALRTEFQALILRIRDDDFRLASPAKKCPNHFPARIFLMFRPVMSYRISGTFRRTIFLP